MSAIGMVLEIEKLALIAKHMDQVDPVSRLAVLEAFGLAVSRVISNVNEFHRDDADRAQADIQEMVNAQRKAMPPDAWAAAIGHAMHSGLSKERIADLVTLFS